MTRARDIANFGDGIATADIGDGQITTAKIASDAITDALLPTGSIIQVQHAKSANTSYSSTTSAYADAVAVSITPTSATSTILIMASGGRFDSSGTVSGEASIRDDGNTVLASAFFSRDAGEFGGGQISMNFLDSPSTTSAITYKLSYRRSAGAGTAFFASSNRIFITVMEIAA